MDEITNCWPLTSLEAGFTAVLPRPYIRSVTKDHCKQKKYAATTLMVFTCPKSTMKTPEQCAQSAQS